jgi:carbamoyltransferase
MSGLQLSGMDMSDMLDVIHVILEDDITMAQSGEHIDAKDKVRTLFFKEFYNKTGCPILFNTSFNLGGEPLVETLEDAIWTLQNSDIEYLFLPEFNKLITVKNKQLTKE